MFRVKNSSLIFPESVRTHTDTLHTRTYTHTHTQTHTHIQHTRMHKHYTHACTHTHTHTKCAHSRTHMLICYTYNITNKMITLCHIITITVGHGNSDGDRIHIDDYHTYVADVIQHVELKHPNLPLFIYGESMVSSALYTTFFLWTFSVFHCHIVWRCCSKSFL